MVRITWETYKNDKNSEKSNGCKTNTVSMCLKGRTMVKWFCKHFYEQNKPVWSCCRKKLWSWTSFWLCVLWWCDVLQLKQQVNIMCTKPRQSKSRLRSAEVLEWEWLNWVLCWSSSGSLYAQALDPVLFSSDGGCVGSVLRDVVLSDVTWVVVIPFQSGRPGWAREAITVHRKDTQRYT